MNKIELKRKISIPAGSKILESEYRRFLEDAYRQFDRFPQYFAEAEDINSLEIAHLIPQVPESILAIYAA